MEMRNSNRRTPPDFLFNFRAMNLLKPEASALSTFKIWQKGLKLFKTILKMKQNIDDTFSTRYLKL